MYRLTIKADANPSSHFKQLSSGLDSTTAQKGKTSTLADFGNTCAMEQRSIQIDCYSIRIDIGDVRVYPTYRKQTKLANSLTKTLGTE
jgi:hypothetical protein